MDRHGDSNCRHGYTIQPSWLYCGSEPNTWDPGGPSLDGARRDIQVCRCLYTKPRACGDDSLTVSPQASFSPRKIGVLAAPQAGYESPRFAETWRILVGEANLDIEKGISTWMGMSRWTLPGLEGYKMQSTRYFRDARRAVEKVGFLSSTSVSSRFPLFARQTHWVVIKMGEP